MTKFMSVLVLFGLTTVAHASQLSKVQLVVVGNAITISAVGSCWQDFDQDHSRFGSNDDVQKLVMLGAGVYVCSGDFEYNQSQKSISINRIDVDSCHHTANSCR